MLNKMATTQVHYPLFDNIILWRHAEAELADFELGEQDSARQLTAKGNLQAKRMGRWLKQHLPKNTILLCSPAVRAVQTAEALHYKIQLENALKPSASLEDILKALVQYQQQKNILIVGHQPWLGELLAYFFEQSAVDVSNTQSISVKKGAVWWLRRHSSETSSHDTSAVQDFYKLYTLQTPSLL